MSTKNVVQNIVWMGVLQVANLGLPLLTLPILARIVGPEKLGVINYAAAVVAYFTLFINYSYELTATRDVAQHRHDPRRLSGLFSVVFHAKLVLLGAATAVFALTYWGLPTFRGDAQVALYTYLLTVASVFSLDWLFQGMQHLRRLAIASLIAKALFTVAVLLVVRDRSDYVWQPLVFSVAQVAVAVGSFVYAQRRYGLALEPFRWAAVRASLAEGRLVFFSKVTMNLYTTTSVVVLGLYQAAEQVGYFTAAHRLIGVAQALLFIPVNNTLFPFIGAAFAESRAAGIDTVKRLIPISFGFAALYSLTIFCVSPLAVRLIYGAQFAPAEGVLQALAVLPFLINCNSFFGIQTMMNLKMDRAFFRVTGMAAGVGLTLNVTLAGPFGYWGTTAAVVLVEVFNVVALYVALRRAGISLLDGQYLRWRYVADLCDTALTKALARARQVAKSISV